MAIPTREDLLNVIDEKLSPEWFDADAMVQAFRTESEIWLRHPDADTVFRVTVEELPRDQSPPLPLP
jgi:hypothetical protein